MATNKMLKSVENQVEKFRDEDDDECNTFERLFGSDAQSGKITDAFRKH